MSYTKKPAELRLYTELLGIIKVCLNLKKLLNIKLSLYIVSDVCR